MGISTRRNPVFEAEAQGERVVRTDQFEWLARAGLLARGVVYGIIGVLAIKLALGDGGKATDQQGALHTIAKQPFGKFLLVVVAVGLAGYALWRLVRAGIGHGPEASDDIKERIDGAISGVGYALLCVTAVSILRGSGAGAGGSSDPDKTTAGVLGWPAGRVLVAVAGLIIVGVGLEQGYRGAMCKFLEKSKTEDDGTAHALGFHRCGRFRPPGANGRLRVDRLLPLQGRDRLRRRQVGGAGRRAGHAGPELVRPDPARHRRGGPDRLRVLLGVGRALPQGVTRPGFQRAVFYAAAATGAGRPAKKASTTAGANRVPACRRSSARASALDWAAW